MERYSWPRDIVAWIFGLLFVSPFVYILFMSVRDNTNVLADPSRIIPESVQLSNYARAPDEFLRISQGPGPLEARGIWLQTLNTLIMAGGVTLGTLVTSALAGYAFARLQFPGRNVIFLALLATLAIPLQAFFLPIYFVFNQEHCLFGTGLCIPRLLNSYWSLILPSISNAFGIFLFRQFFLTIPKELEEAAIIDGANHWQIFSRVMLPLSTPAMLALGILTFVWEWNDVFKPLVFTNAVQDRWTLGLGLALFNVGSLTRSQVTVQMAVVVLVSLVPILVFLIFQRQFVRGIASTGLKG